MPKLIITIEETVSPEGEDRFISAFAFKAAIAPMPEDTDETETNLFALLMPIIQAIHGVLGKTFGDPVVSKIAVVPPNGSDPLPSLDTMVDDYKASLKADKDADFPADLEISELIN